MPRTIAISLFRTQPSLASPLHRTHRHCQHCGRAPKRLHSSQRISCPSKPRHFDACTCTKARPSRHSLDRDTRPPPVLGESTLYRTHCQPTSSPTLTAALAALPPGQTHSLLHRITRRQPSLPPPPTPPAPRDRDTGDGRTPRATRAPTLFDFPNGESLSPRHSVRCVIWSPSASARTQRGSVKKSEQAPGGCLAKSPAACFILRRPSQSPAPLLC